MEVLRASSFWRDVKGIIDYLDKVHAEDAALRFLAALDETIEFIREFPDLGSPWESSKPRHAGLRFQFVKGFETYLVLYRRDDQRAFILRVLYSGRNLEELLG
jgi:plasmid stabilization system protein ParE